MSTLSLTTLRAALQGCCGRHDRHLALLATVDIRLRTLGQLFTKRDRSNPDMQQYSNRNAVLQELATLLRELGL